MLRRLLTYCLLAVAAAMSAAPKSEFRGAWIQTIYQGYEKRSTADNKAYLTDLLDRLHDAGINAVIFQVRPRADAFYDSKIEPWSSFLTGKTGRAPSPAWDPLEFMVREAHERGMELHAWLNPYRAPTVAEAASLPSGHLLKTSPKRFVKYGKGYYFDPSQQVNRDHICRVVRDIVSRYDVDGIHFDDYFYPYPVAGAKFPDAKAYAAAKTRMSLADWRRHNVELLIEQVSRTIAGVKPWVRFGISPFGIWRNSTSDPRGSKTRGLQNYDDLYADVPAWAEKGLIDYQIPQIYWPLDHNLAPYRELAPWWVKNGRGRHVYIGQDVEKTADFGELEEKMAMAEAADGNCWWYAATLDKVTSQLKRKRYAAPALVPEYIWKHAEPASRPGHLKFRGGELTWHRSQDARKWVVYRFDSDKHIDIENPAAICAVTYKPAYRPTRGGVYVVTALDHANGESAPSSSLKIKL